MQAYYRYDHRDDGLGRNGGICWAKHATGYTKPEIALKDYADRESSLK